MSELNFTLKVPAGHKPGACAQGNNVRYSALSNALCYRAGEQTYLASSSGSAFAVLPVESAGEFPRPVALPPKALNGNGRGATVSVSANGEVRTRRGSKEDVAPLPEQEGRWPNLKMVFPAIDKLDGYTPVILDAGILAGVADAVAAGGIILLLVPPPDRKLGCAVTPVPVLGGGADTGPLGFGLIMPLGGTALSVADRIAYLKKHVANLPGSVVLTPERPADAEAPAA